MCQEASKVKARRRQLCLPRSRGVAGQVQRRLLQCHRAMRTTSPVLQIGMDCSRFSSERRRRQHRLRSLVWLSST